MTPKEHLQVKVELDEEMAEKFLTIKQTYGLKTNADTVRFCIAQQYKQNRGK